MKSLLKFFTITALFTALFIGSSLAQSLYFCEGVDDDGYPKNDATSFTIGSSGGYLYMLVRTNYDVNTEHVYFDIYKVDRNGRETYYDTLEMDTESNWNWFWKKITFYNSGNYNVYVADEDDYPICSGSVRISYR